MEFSTFEFGFTCFVIVVLYGTALSHIERAQYRKGFIFGAMFIAFGFVMHDMIGARLIEFFSMGELGFAMLALITAFFSISFIFNLLALARTKLISKEQL